MSLIKLPETEAAQAQQVLDLTAELAKLREEHGQLLDEVHTLRLYADGKRDWAFDSARRKIERQREALNLLTARNTRLRFALKLMNRLREPVTNVEWTREASAIEDEQYRARLGKEVPSAA